jgi:hypothetical protein
MLTLDFSIYIFIAVLKFFFILGGCPVALTCLPKLLGRLRYKGLQFQASLGKKVCENPISAVKRWVWWHGPVISVKVGSVK